MRDEQETLTGKTHHAPRTGLVRTPCLCLMVPQASGRLERVAETGAIGHAGAIVRAHLWRTSLAPASHEQDG